MKKLQVAAVLSSYNRGSKIKQTIQSLLTQTYPLAEIILIDDGSEKGKQIPKFSSKRITQVYLPKNVGVVWGRNLGLSKCSKYDYVLLIDDDIVLEKTCIEQLITAISLDENAIAVMPVVSFLSKKGTVWSAGSGVNLVTGQTLFYTKKPKNSLEPIPAATSVLLVSMSAIKKVGWQDSLFYFCYEDADFYYRIRTLGEIFVVKAAHAYHDIPLNLSLDRVALRSYYIGRGRILFLYRHGKNFFLNFVCVSAFTLYYAYLGLKYGRIMTGLRYAQGVLDGLHLISQGKATLSPQVNFRKNLTIADLTSPDHMQKHNTRI